MNSSGGNYVCGRKYGVETKHRVVTIYLEMKADNDGNNPCHVDVAEVAGVSKSYVMNVIRERKENGGNVLDPSPAVKKKVDPKYRKLKGEDAIFLLALRAEDDRRYLKDYKRILAEEKGLNVSHTLIHRFFRDRFKYKGKLKTTTMVPIDKF